MQTKKGTAPQALDASDFAGQLELDLLVQMAAAHGRGTPEYIASCIQFAPRSASPRGLPLLHVRRAPAPARPPDECVTLPTAADAGRGPAADGVVHRYQEVQRRADC
jgi:hypothetical protein